MATALHLLHPWLLLAALDGAALHLLQDQALTEVVCPHQLRHSRPGSRAVPTCPQDCSAGSRELNNSYMGFVDMKLIMDDPVLHEVGLQRA